jgi:phosphatidate cytidylyltransferase
MRRILTAVVLLPLFWLLVQRAPPPVFHAVAVLAICRAAWECYGLLELRGGRPFKLLGLLACVAVTIPAVAQAWAPAAEAALAGLVIAAAAAALWARDDPPAMLDTWLSTLFPVAFVGLTLAHVVALRALPGEDGRDLPMLLVACVVAADTAAYYVGTAWGRHRLAPRVSPRKSWEGFAGGFAASVLAAVVAHLWFYRRLPAGHAVALGALLAAAALLGDLAESAVKRAAGAKDASRLLPGHGGLLDRLDSLLFSGPLLYYYHGFLLAGS